jgi:hypothetical protein
MRVDGDRPRLVLWVGGMRTGTSPNALGQLSGVGGIGTATSSKALGPLSGVGGIGTATSSKAVGALSGVTGTATTTTSKALGPLEAAQSDIFARNARSIGPTERPRPDLALSVRQDCGGVGGRRLRNSPSSTRSPNPWWTERANLGRESLSDHYPSEQRERGYVAQRPRAR